MARAQWAAAHARFAPVPLRFHAAGRRPCTGLRRKNSVKDRNRLADRKGEEETRMESRSFGQKATVVSKVYTPPVNTKPGFFSILNRFFYYRRMKGKKKKGKSNLQAVVCDFDPHGDEERRFPRLMRGHVHRFVSRCLSIGIFTSSRAIW